MAARLRRIGAILLLAAPLVLLSACENTVTRSNFERIETGMSRAEVIDLLGKPDEQSSVGIGEFTGGTAAWDGGGRRISVVFANGNVTLKSFGNIPAAARN